MQAYVVTNDGEAKALTKEWLDEVDHLFQKHPKLGMVVRPNPRGDLTTRHTSKSH